MAIIEHYPVTNPYQDWRPEQLENEIQELVCAEQDHEYRHDFEHADMAREHRLMATEALLGRTGMRFYD